MGQVKKVLGESTPSWRVVLNGRLPAIREFANFHEAVDFISVETGDSVNRVLEAFEAGCPTIRERDAAEFDIEEVKEAA
mgnify:CR=1 FL=1